MRPKHHYQFHVPDQIRAKGVLLDCFAPERANGNFKLHVAPHLKKLSTFEDSSLVRLLSIYLRDVQEFHFDDGFRGTTKQAMFEGRPAVVGSCLMLGGKIFVANQTVLSNNDAMLIRAVLQLPEGFHLLADHFVFEPSLRLLSHLCFQFVSCLFVAVITLLLARLSCRC